MLRQGSMRELMGGVLPVDVRVDHLSPGLLAALGWHLGFAWIYFTALVLAAGLAYRHYLMIRSRSREACFKAFLHNNWIGAVIFVGIALQYAAVL